MSNQTLEQTVLASGSFAGSNANAASMQITRELAKKVLATVDEGLVGHLGVAVPGQMCVEAAVCFGLGLPHGDDPPCVSRALRSFKIRLNDASWSTPQERAKGLRRLALVQLGSRDKLDDQEFVRRVIHLIIGKQLPRTLRSTAAAHKDPAHQAALNAAADQCERDPTDASCHRAHNAAFAASSTSDDAAYFASEAAEAALLASKKVASGGGIAEAAHEAARAGAHAARSAACACKESGDTDIEDQTRDRALAEFAEDVVGILTELQVPGCEWLELTQAA